jgi:hypothetical protein
VSQTVRQKNRPRASPVLHTEIDVFLQIVDVNYAKVFYNKDMCER